MTSWHFHLWLGHKTRTCWASGRKPLSTGAGAAQLLRAQPAPGPQLGAVVPDAPPFPARIFTCLVQGRPQSQVLRGRPGSPGTAYVWCVCMPCAVCVCPSGGGVYMCACATWCVCVQTAVVGVCACVHMVLVGVCVWCVMCVCARARTPCSCVPGEKEWMFWRGRKGTFCLERPRAARHHRAFRRGKSALPVESLFCPAGPKIQLKKE